MAIVYRMMIITPEIAQQYLALNIDHNRNLNQDRIIKYARDMRDGKWALNHQGIAFDVNGRLVDGQHRLHAIITAGVPVAMMVATGVEPTPENIMAIDMGQPRTFNNIMDISGISDEIYKRGCSTMKAYIRFQCGVKGSTIGATMVYDAITARKIELQSFLDAICMRTKGHGGAVPCIMSAAMFTAFLHGEELEMLTEAARVWRCNETKNGDYYPKPILDVRQAIKDKDRHLPSYELCKKAIMCFKTKKKGIKEVPYPYDSRFDGFIKPETKRVTSKLNEI